MFAATGTAWACVAQRYVVSAPAIEEQHSVALAQTCCPAMLQAANLNVDDQEASYDRVWTTGKQVRESSDPGQIFRV